MADDDDDDDSSMSAGEQGIQEGFDEDVRKGFGEEDDSPSDSDGSSDGEF